MNSDELKAFVKEKKGLAARLLKKKPLKGIYCNLIHLEQNQVIYNEGDKVDSIFFVVSGEVMVSNNSELISINEEEFFGTESNENNRRRSKAITIKPGIILELVIDKNPIQNVPLPLHDNLINQQVKPASNRTTQFGENEIKRDMDEDFNISIHNDIRIVFINLVKATLNESKTLLNLLTDLIRQGEKKIVVDLRMCNIVDSTFLGSLVKSHKSIKDKEGEIVLIYETEQQSTLFMITYMDKVFKTFKNIDEAINYFES